MVVWSYPPTPKQLAVSAVIFIAGATLIAVGAHISLTNVAHQQARTKARRDFVKQRLRNLLEED